MPGLALPVLGGRHLTAESASPNACLDYRASFCPECRCISLNAASGDLMSILIMTIANAISDSYEEAVSDMVCGSAPIVL